MRNINDLAKTIHADNVAVGWWDKPGQCLFEKLQLVSTEIAEATEGERKNLMDDKLPHRKMGEVELADALIRLLDLAGHTGWVYDKYEESTELLRYCATKGVAGMHMAINVEISRIALNLYYLGIDDDIIPLFYSRTVDNIIKCAENLGYDIFAAMDEKLEYNRNRADHKRENRAKEGGKAF